MALDTKERNEIILAAVNMAGPVGDDLPEWNSRVRANTKKLTIMLGENSNLAKIIDMVKGCKIFSGTILHVAKEKSSKRGFVGLKTTPSKFNADGIESVRTEIMEDNPEVLAFCRQLRSLEGHRVLVWVEMQTNEDATRKFRILQHVEDLGLDPDYDADEAKELTLAKLRK
ncbi:hypothetical protein [Arthrobacter caoxuetaonis]|uniref:Uncharacterized protein n=1 Tax=Arthrobacter caoxuetaonis TaxID=2886935 RepID=A0A9X1MIB3_9MICC|nr:hypothetical protein [Arthrobacter caoxuetaonis]MCC3299452.1 hypothetical protein [Arthrobacter caoxuetaonis]USQ59056.1 hypothetical protein NF551_18290 [Arthrobacter caoxuetaonis]